MITDNVKNAQKRHVGIYIHVPFCRSKCYYCDFCSKTRATDEQIGRYVDALCAEIKFISERIKDSGNELPIADTVYFGGGTPTLLDPKSFERALRSVSDSFGICDSAEITAEANPKTADLHKLCDMRNLGINRLSIGMQSVHGAELRALGRAHSFEDFCAVYKDARRAGFDNVSADLMYGIPDQTSESFEVSVKTLADMSPEHISSYCLTVEEGTTFDRCRHKLNLPDEDAVADMYSMMSDTLSKQGYGKYEISNFAHKGYESRHNIKYWRLDDYIGFGSAAHSYFDGVRFAHTRDIESYISGENTYCEVCSIQRREAMNEYVMLGMRLADGINISDFEARFGENFENCFGAKLKKYAPEHVYMDKNVCRLTPKGMFVSNFILSDVLDFGD